MQTTTLMIDLKDNEISGLVALCSLEKRAKLACLCESPEQADALISALELKANAFLPRRMVAPRDPALDGNRRGRARSQNIDDDVRAERDEIACADKSAPLADIVQVADVFCAVILRPPADSERDRQPTVPSMDEVQDVTAGNGQEEVPLTLLRCKKLKPHARP